jgi:hypothetical protein
VVRCLRAWELGGVKSPVLEGVLATLTHHAEHLREELVEVMEAAGVIEPAGEPGAWRLVDRGRYKLLSGPVALNSADDDDVVDAEIVDG